MAQTKTQIKSATVQVGKLLKGIDNDAIAIKKGQEIITKKLENVAKNTTTVKNLMVGISNAAIASTESKPAAKPEKSAKAAKSAKVVTAKPAKAAKPAKVKPAKAAKPAKLEAKSTNGSPSLKQVAKGILSKNGKPMGAANLYKEVTKVHDWSRQSLYNALKDEKTFRKTGDGANAQFSLINSGPDDSDEAERFVKSIESNPAVSNVV